MTSRTIRLHLLASALACSLPGWTRAQTLCFEPAPLRFATPGASNAVAADFDGDGDTDLAFSSSTELLLATNLGAGSFAAPVPIAPLVATRCRAADVDADGRIDLVLTAGVTHLVRNVGGGVFVASSIDGNPVTGDLSVGDVDGNGLLDVVVTRTSFWPSSASCVVLRNFGAGSFLGTILSFPATQVGGHALADVDADGDLDLVASMSDYGALHVRRNDGTGEFGTPSSLAAPGLPTSVAAGDLDGDTLVDLLATDLETGVLSLWRNSGAGSFAPRVDLSFGAGVPFEIGLCDLDADSDLDVVAAFAQGGPPVASGRVDVFLNDGAAGLVSSTLFVTTDPLSHAACADFDLDGDLDLVSRSFVGSTGPVEVWRNCERAGRALCAGDGSASACPCGNQSPAGSLRGCLNSTGASAGLRGSGALQLSNDGCVLVADGMPASTLALFFQGATALGGGAGVVFGDGLSCAAGSIVRLSTKAALAGAARFPETGDVALSVRGAITAPGTRAYQVLYRDTQSYCTTAAFNLSNALIAEWR